jgi:prolyl oligopeptidase
MLRALLLLTFMGGMAMGGALKYPVAKKQDVVDDYFGTKVADPYRWLENTDSPETLAWVKAENELSLPYLEKLPDRNDFHERLTKLLNYERYSTPYWIGGRYIYQKNDGLQNQSVIYTVKNLTDTPQVVLDPNQLAKDGTVSVGIEGLSNDGKYFAYGLEASGSDWTEIRVKDLDSGQELPDVIKWVKFSDLGWSKDNAGFFYTRYPQPDNETDQKLAKLGIPSIYYHRLGHPQSEDVLVYQRPDHPQWFLSASTSKDGRYLIIQVSQNQTDKIAIYVKDLGETGEPKLDGEAQPIFDQFDAKYWPIAVAGSRLFLRTDKDAPTCRVISVDLTKHAANQADEVIPATKDLLEDAALVGGKLVLNYLVDATNQLKVVSLDGHSSMEVPLPALGSIGSISGDQDRPELFYSFTSFLYPATIFRYDVETGKGAVFRKPSLDINADDYVTEQIFYHSKDGTRVPLFIVRRKDSKLDGNNQVYLTGYGGFDISMKPFFSTSYFAWVQKGGIFAQPNLRGGGEYGREWHEAGTREHKQNVFDDFIAAAETLINLKYTTAKQLSITGKSNGGLLIGACVTQRPDLFGAAVPGVGVMDMLRFQKFTVGYAWISDFGSSDNPEDFKYLFRYSPLHNIHPGTCYPPTLITTADHDDRVVPGHSFKFAATLQAAQGCDNPVLIRIDTKAGHGGGKPLAKAVDEAADVMAFMWDNTKPEPAKNR